MVEFVCLPCRSTIVADDLEQLVAAVQAHERAEHHLAVTRHEVLEYAHLV